jgi:hypothetical protein
MKINELRALIKEAIDEAAFTEGLLLFPELDDEKAKKSYDNAEDAYKFGYIDGYNDAKNEKS